MTAKQLRQMFKLSHKVSVYVPELTKSGERCEDWSDRTAELLAGLFGGSTSSDAVGYWILSTSGKLQRENVKLVFSYAEQLTDSAIDAIYTHAEAMKLACSQDSCALELDGELFLI